MPTFRKDLHLGHDVPLVETDDIMSGAITEDKLADNSVSTRTIQDGAVTEHKLSDDSVSTRTIQDGSVTEPKLADNSVSARTIQPDAIDGSNIQPGSIENKHLADDAITTPKIKDKAVTPAKRSDDFDAMVVLPYVNPIDDKYSEKTNELYEMVASLQVGGIALSGRLGNREDIGIHQKALTNIFGRILADLEELNGKKYMDFTLTVQPTSIIKEGVATVNVTADCSEAISNFDSIMVYLDDVLKAENSDITTFNTAIQIEADGTHTVKAVGVIAGKTFTKTQSVTKTLPFFMGGGQNYQDILVPECAKELVGTLEGDYDVRIPHNGDYMFIIIPASHKDEFRRADMNGYEIPLTKVHEDVDIVAYKSGNTYNQGTYNVDIDINS